MDGANGDRTTGEVADYEAELRQSGHLVASYVLRPAETATSVRLRYGGIAIEAGPYNGPADHLGGFLIIEARDLNEAIRLASRFPPAHEGCIEIRAIEVAPTA